MAQTINARVQFSTASLADWDKINPQLKEGELVLVKLDSGKYRLIVGAIGGSKFKDSVLVWDEVDAETLLANTEKASAAASASASAAKTSETNAKASETASKTSETNAKASETASKTSETNAKASETASKTSESNAKTSATNAAISESNAKASETASASSAKTADTSAQNAEKSSASAGSFASQAGDSAKAASTSAGNAATSETNAAKFAEEAKTHADKIAQYDPKALIAEAHHYIQRNTAYNVGDVLTSPNLPYGTTIIVTQSGTTGADEPDWDSIKNNMGGVNDDGTLKFRTESMFQQVLKQAILMAHPVGSIYESTDATSPETLFGGTWEAMEAGRVLVSAGTASTGTVYNAGDKGGEEATGLSIDNLPPHSFSGTTSTAGAHSHNITAGQSWSSGGSPRRIAYRDDVGVTNFSVDAAGNHNHTFTTNTLGSGVKHNNLQPYEVIHRWKRTA